MPNVKLLGLTNGMSRNPNANARKLKGALESVQILLIDPNQFTLKI